MRFNGILKRTLVESRNSASKLVLVPKILSIVVYTQRPIDSDSVTVVLTAISVGS